MGAYYFFLTGITQSDWQFKFGFHQDPMLYPSADKISLIISHEQNTKTKPIIAEYKNFFPVPINLGLPAEISMSTPPIVTPTIAKGVAISKTRKL